MDDDAIDRACHARRGNPFLNSGQAAHHLGVTVRTLERMRQRGDGPPVRRHGRSIRYHVDDLDSWSRTNGSGSGHTESGHD